MKFSTYLLIILILSSCTYRGFNDANQNFCIPDNTSNFSNNLMPIMTGNKWIFKYEYSDEYLKELDNDEKSVLKDTFTLEIGSKKTIYLKKDGDLIPITAYIIIQDGIESENIYYVPCASGTSFVEVNNQEELIVAGSFFISNTPNNETMYWDGIFKAKLEWISTAATTSPIETGSMYILQEYMLNNNILNQNDKKINPASLFYKTGRSWYKPGVGLTKKEVYMGKLFVGTITLISHEFEKTSSPIEP